DPLHVRARLHVLARELADERLGRARVHTAFAGYLFLRAQAAGDDVGERRTARDRLRRRPLAAQQRDAVRQRAARDAVIAHQQLAAVLERLREVRRGGRWAKGARE